MLCTYVAQLLFHPLRSPHAPEPVSDELWQLKITENYDCIIMALLIPVCLGLISFISTIFLKPSMCQDVMLCYRTGTYRKNIILLAAQILYKPYLTSVST